MCHFFNLRKSHQTSYVFDELPPVRELSYSRRNPRQYKPAVSRTTRFSNTYFQNVLFEWNLLEEDVRHSLTIGEFKRKLLAKIRPDKKSTFAFSDTHGVKCLTKLRVRFSPSNEHRFHHNFEASSSSMMA